MITALVIIAALALVILVKILNAVSTPRNGVDFGAVAVIAASTARGLVKAGALAWACTLLVVLINAGLNG